MSPDAVIFDVDGVLVDVRESFLAAIKRSVQHAVLTETGALDDGPLVDDATIAAFKRAGGFNNDWDLARALVLWFAEGGRARTTSEIRERAGDAAAAARVTLAARIARARRPPYQDVKDLMLELYWGSAEAARRFGVRPTLDVRDPLAATERVLLRRETVEALRKLYIRRFGVLTGRLLVEWEFVRGRIPLPADVAVATDEDGRKPDPAILRRVVERLGARRPCYVGDVRDDWELVRGYNERYASSPALGVFVASDGDDERALRDAGATLFVRDVNELPALLARD